jgi:hypothetical protein
VGARFQWEEVMPGAEELEPFTGSPFWGSEGEQEGQKEVLDGGETRATLELRRAGCSGRTSADSLRPSLPRAWARSACPPAEPRPPAAAGPAARLGRSLWPRRSLRLHLPRPAQRLALPLARSRARARASPAHTCSLAVRRAEPAPLAAPLGAHAGPPPRLCTAPGTEQKERGRERAFG